MIHSEELVVSCRLSVATNTCCVSSRYVFLSHLNISSLFLSTKPPLFSDPESISYLMSISLCFSSCFSVGDSIANLADNQRGGGERFLSALNTMDQCAGDLSEVICLLKWSEQVPTQAKRQVSNYLLSGPLDCHLFAFQATWWHNCSFGMNERILINKLKCSWAKNIPSASMASFVLVSLLLIVVTSHLSQNHFSIRINRRVFRSLGC